MHFNSPLYSSIKPYAQHSLQVDSLHSLHIEECGNPYGIPVLFIHGGPGGSYAPIHRQFFHPDHYRIVLFDQRGCGKSRPHACLTNNTTAHLIEDIEKIRRHLDVDQWLLFGGSWGSTLSLLYAQAYPERVVGLILRGLFLCRNQDIRWFYQSGADRIYPDFWQDFISPIEESRRDDLVAAYYDLLTGDDDIAKMRAAEAWSIWEGRTSHLVTDNDTVRHFGDPHHAMAMARIECHYFYHDAFIEPNQILSNMHVLEHIPISIVQGRHDMVCPFDQAYSLFKASPHSKLIVCEASGHSAMELEISRALVAETNLFIEHTPPL